MNQLGLKATPTEKYVVTTDSNHTLHIYPNLVNRQFNITKPNRVWVADITYIWTMEGWLYLASIMDLYSRKIIGWSLDSHMRKELPLQALENALNSREVSDKLIHHSDRGSQYCSNDYVDKLRDSEIQISMSRKGDPYDNACIESFHATLKKELVYRTKYKTRAEARKAIANYIISFYNERRRHSTIGYLSPNVYERMNLLVMTEKIS
jgi:putative transposase